MKRILPMLLLQCLCITVQGQNLLIEAGAGIAGNTGIKNKDIRSRGKGFAAPGVHMALMADMKRWQVGVIGDVYSIRHSTSFVYEQYLTPMEPMLRNIPTQVYLL